MARAAVPEGHACQPPGPRSRPLKKGDPRMTTALDAEIVEVLKDLGGAVHVTQVRRGLRDRGGRPVSEELLLRLCRQSPRLREVATGRFALLADLADEPLAPTDDPEDDECDAGLALGDLAAVRSGSYVAFDLE